MYISYTYIHYCVIMYYTMLHCVVLYDSLFYYEYGELPAFCGDATPRE